MQIMFEGERLVIPDDCPNKLKVLITACWEQGIVALLYYAFLHLSSEPEKRPSFADILIALDQLSLPKEWCNLFETAGATKAEV